MKSVVRRIPALAGDVWLNRRCRQPERRILVTRHCGKHSSMFRDFYSWVTREVPELASRFEFRRLPYRLLDADRYHAHVSWINDTLDVWSPSGYAQACRLLQVCRDRGLTCINPIDQIANVGKARGAMLMRQAGIRTPRCMPLADPHAIDLEAMEINFPVLIREERGHGRHADFLGSPEDLRTVDLSKYQNPIIAEFVDTRDPVDGLYRKYRYVSAGDVGVPRHLIINEQWDVRPHGRVQTNRAIEEEAAYVESPDSHHARLERARNALGMDVVGFDYSLTPEGELIVWEANPYLDMNYPKYASHDPLVKAVERTFAALARLYLCSAGVDVPSKIKALLDDAATY